MKLFILGFVEYERRHGNDGHKKEEGIISRQERLRREAQMTGYRQLDNTPLHVLEKDDKFLFDRFGSDRSDNLDENGEELYKRKPRLNPFDVIIINHVLKAGIPDNIEATLVPVVGSTVAWDAFGKVITKHFGARAATALGLAAGDAVLPIGDAVAFGLLAVTALEIANNWDELWSEAEQILVQQEPEAQIYTIPTDEQVDSPITTGHENPEVETGTPPISTDPQVESPVHTGSELEKPVAEDYVLASKRRNLRKHDNAGGHTIDRHIGKPDQWLRNRQRNENKKDVSTFSNNAVGNLTQARFIKMYKTEINEWLKKKKSGRTFTKIITMDRETGKVKPGRGKIRSTNRARVVLMKDNSELGYRIQTSYPVP